MKQIQLVRLEMIGFRSFKQHTIVEFSRSVGLKFIGGDNQIDQRLGANGAGKSTLFDAICYSAYGTSVKGVRAGNLVSWGTKEISTTTHWLIDGAYAKITRQGNPDRLTINDLPAEQADVDRLLGLSKSRFLHSVIFGQAVPLFVDLSVPERGVILDEVLELGIWLKASETASKALSAAGKTRDEAHKALAFLNGKLEGMESEDSIKSAIASWQREQEARIDSALAEMEQAERDFVPLKLKMQQTSAAVSALPSSGDVGKQIQIHQSAKAQREAEYREFFSDAQKAIKRIEYYKHTKQCDICGQAVSSVFAGTQIQSLTRSKQDAEQSIKGNGAQQIVINDKLNELIAEQDKLTRKRDFLIEQRTTAASAYREQERLVQAMESAIEKMAEVENPHQARLDALTAEREQIQKQISETKSGMRRAQSVMLRLEFWVAAFKRVRLFAMKRILIQMEMEVASATAALGLVGWKIGFTTELETKSGSVRPGVHTLVTSPIASAPWESWSGGEGQRIRLAVAMGIAGLIQRMAGISIGLEVYDEPSAWLSPEGIEDLLECLKHRAQVQRKSLYLCDHRSLIYSGFSEIWQIQKTSAGSKVNIIATGG